MNNNLKKIELEERKKLQLDILDSIHNFCVKNNIKYTLAYGTLLGTVRHGGYIPWDDDVDIAMLRKDYELFVNKFNDDRYKVATFENTNILLSFAKVYDSKTVIVDRKANTHSLGVNVDLFPIDNSPESDLMYRINRLHIRLLKYCNVIKLFKFNKETSVMNNMVGLVAKAFLILFPKTYFVKRIICLSKKYNDKETIKAINWAAAGDFLPLEKSIYNNLQLVPFEDRHYFAIVDADKYLSNEYGDYMTPPPIEKRISYHTSDAYWK
ncbi:MAG: LicD family protein [Bacteroidia bacterium]|nr:LicD family protein [Bacteroidia bacterium]